MDSIVMMGINSYLIISGAMTTVLVIMLWSDPLKLHKSEQSDQSVLRGAGG